MLNDNVLVAPDKTITLPFSTSGVGRPHPGPQRLHPGVDKVLVAPAGADVPSARLHEPASRRPHREPDRFAATRRDLGRAGAHLLEPGSLVLPLIGCSSRATRATVNNVMRFSAQQVREVADADQQERPRRW